MADPTAIDKVIAQSTDPDDESGREPVEYVLQMQDGSARVFDTVENIVLPPQSADLALGALGYWWTPPGDLDLTRQLAKATWIDDQDTLRRLRHPGQTVGPSALAQRVTRRLEWSRSASFVDGDDELTADVLTRRWRAQTDGLPVRILAYVDSNDDFQTVERLLGNTHPDAEILATPGDEVWVVSANGFDADIAQKAVRPARVVRANPESPRHRTGIDRGAFTFVVWADTGLDLPPDLFDERAAAVIVESSGAKSEYRVRQLLDRDGGMPIFLAYQPQTARVWQAGAATPNLPSLKSCLTMMWDTGSGVRNLLAKVIPPLRPDQQRVWNATVSAGVTLPDDDLRPLLEDLERKVNIDVNELLDAIAWAREPDNRDRPLADRQT
jgi:hypothetical protein